MLLATATTTLAWVTHGTCNIKPDSCHRNLVLSRTGLVGSALCSILALEFSVRRAGFHARHLPLHNRHGHAPYARFRILAQPPAVKCAALLNNSNVSGL